MVKYHDLSCVMHWRYWNLLRDSLQITCKFVRHPLSTRFHGGPGQLSPRHEISPEQKVASSCYNWTVLNVCASLIWGRSNGVIGEKVNQQDFGVNVSHLRIEDHCDDTGAKTCSKMNLGGPWWQTSLPTHTTCSIGLWMPIVVPLSDLSDRRKFRSQTSDNMDRWKSRGGKSQRGEAKKWEDQIRERRCRSAKK